MDPSFQNQGQIDEQKESELKQHQSDYLESIQPSESENDSDPSFKIESSKQDSDQDELAHSSGKLYQNHRNPKKGLKYAKISNECREALIQQIQTTGCTIKKAALDLDINFSTAKAIMQIYKKEGRSVKKEVRKNKKRRGQVTSKQIKRIQSKHLNVLTKQEDNNQNQTKDNSPKIILSNKNELDKQIIENQAFKIQQQQQQIFLLQNELMQAQYQNQELKQLNYALLVNQSSFIPQQVMPFKYV